MRSLVPCPECGRHLRRTEISCPFCAAPVADALARAPERPLPPFRMSRAGVLAFLAASVTGPGCGGVATTGTAGSGDSGSSGVGGLLGTGGTVSAGGQLGRGGTTENGGAPDSGGVPAVFYGAPFPVPMTGGSGGTGVGGNGGAFPTPSTGGNAGMGFGGSSGTPDSGTPNDAGALCFNGFDHMQHPCCSKTAPDCSNKPDGYPGYGCTPSPGSFCACTCERGQWLCGC
jgi:hypothetical protein